MRAAMQVRPLLHHGAFHMRVHCVRRVRLSADFPRLELATFSSHDHVSQFSNSWAQLPRGVSAAS
jgi:hypothetical protein